jgi:hypothetical protein
MVRPNATLHLLAPMLVAAAVLAGACGGHPEEAQLQQFFRASSLGDNQSLASFAAVNFDPKTDGAVSSFTIVTVSEPRVEPLKIKDLAKALDDALAADKEFTDRKRTYQDAHIGAIDRILKTENTSKKPSGPDAAVQMEWTRWREETLASSKKVSDARSHLSNARSIPELSLSTPNSPAPDLSKADGQMESKDVAITATIRMRDGSTAQKNLVVTMQRALIKATPADKTGRWIFAAVKAAS